MFSLFYSNTITIPLLSVANQTHNDGKLNGAVFTFLRNIIRSDNPVLRTLSRLCDYDFRELAAIYNINSVHLRPK